MPTTAISSLLSAPRDLVRRAAFAFTVSIVAATVVSFDINVPPYSMMQVRIPNDGSYGDIALQFTSSSGTWWSSYGACVDNISGDSWSSHGALAF